MPIPRVRPSTPKLREILVLLGLARHRVTAAGVEQRIRDRLGRREELFLNVAERHIFGASKSPYRPLLDLAGYDFARLRQIVLSLGVDDALDRLWQDGVYIRIREFKGQEPARRGDHTFQFRQSDFANPDVAPVLQSWTSGSTRASVRSAVSAEEFLNSARVWGWLLEGYGLSDRDFVLWMTPRMGLRGVLTHIVLRRAPLRWFTLDRIDRTYTLFVHAARLITGLPIPLPQPMPADAVLQIARHIAAVNSSRGMIVQTMVSSALRLVLAAEEAGIRLGDVVFIMGGEPLTPTKRRQFETRGYGVISAFAFAEFGSAAWACSHGREPDDLHVLTDRLALRQYPRFVDHNGAAVSAYLFTGLLPDMRHIMVNMESGDYGGLETRGCGCFLERAGLRQHMHTIRSFEKLTAEGLTFVGPTLIGLLEEILPGEFGGTQADYQLVEAEDAGGQTRLYLLASPRLGPLDEGALRGTVLREIRDRHISPGDGRQIHRIWERADTIQILRRRPLATYTGKIHHLHRHDGTLAAERGEVQGGAE